MIETITASTLPGLFDVLPAKMCTTPAFAMLLAIGLQESKFQDRRQGAAGPARGFWQFELNGVRGVMSHDATRVHARTVLRALRYGAVIGHKAQTTKAQNVEIQKLLEHNDLLAAAFARLLLWTIPSKLPTRSDSLAGWRQYLEGWRPGKPHPETWPANYALAWDLWIGEHDEG